VSCCEAAVRGGRVEIRAAATRAAGTHLPTICCCCVCVCVCVYTHTHTHVVKYRTRLRNAHFVRCPPLVRCSSLCPAHQPTLRAITTTTMMMMMMMRRRGSVHGCVHDCMLTTCVCVCVTTTTTPPLPLSLLGDRLLAWQYIYYTHEQTVPTALRPMQPVPPPPPRTTTHHDAPPPNRCHAPPLPAAPVCSTPDHTTRGAAHPRFILSSSKKLPLRINRKHGPCRVCRLSHTRDTQQQQQQQQQSHSRIVVVVVVVGESHTLFWRMHSQPTILIAPATHTLSLIIIGRL